MQILRSNSTHRIGSDFLHAPNFFWQVVKSNEFVEVYRALNSNPNKKRRGNCSIIAIFFLGAMIIFSASLMVQVMIAECSYIRKDSITCLDSCRSDYPEPQNFPNNNQSTSVEPEEKHCVNSPLDPDSFWYIEPDDNSPNEKFTFCFHSPACQLGEEDKVNNPTLAPTTRTLLCFYPSTMSCPIGDWLDTLTECCWTALLGLFTKWLICRIILRRYLVTNDGVFGEMFLFLRNLVPAVLLFGLAISIAYLLWLFLWYAIIRTLWIFACVQLLDWTLFGSILGGFHYIIYYRHCFFKSIPASIRYEPLDNTSLDSRSQENIVSDPVEAPANHSKHFFSTSKTE